MIAVIATGTEKAIVTVTVTVIAIATASGDDQDLLTTAAVTEEEMATSMPILQAATIATGNERTVTLDVIVEEIVEIVEIAEIAEIVGTAENENGTVIEAHLAETLVAMMKRGLADETVTASMTVVEVAEIEETTAAVFPGRSLDEARRLPRNRANQLQI